MATCKLFDRCEFCKKLDALSPETCEKYTQRYCKGDHHACARFMVAGTVGVAAVPEAMLPTETDRALGIIGRARKSPEQTSET